MKKILFVTSVFFLFLGLAPHVSAAAPQGFTALAPIPGLTDTSVTNVLSTASLATFFNNLYKYLIGIAAILAILQIIWAGIKMAYFNKDSASAIKKSRETIQQAILGLVLVLLPVLVFSIINPSILNLSLNLPKLDTAAKTTTTSSATTPLATQPATLSSAETQLRESAGGKVIFTFTISSADLLKSTPIMLGQTLDAKQTECTQKTSGLGIILPSAPLGGGGYNYVCQTCPSNTAVILFAKGKKGSGARGACQPK